MGSFIDRQRVLRCGPLRPVYGLQENRRMTPILWLRDTATELIPLAQSAELRQVLRRSLSMKSVYMEKEQDR